MLDLCAITVILYAHKISMTVRINSNKNAKFDSHNSVLLYTIGYSLMLF